MLYQKHNSIGSYYLQTVVYNRFSFTLHAHRFPELIFVLSGAVEICCGSRVETAKAGQFALVLGNLPHAYRTPKSSKVWVTVFSKDWVPDFKRDEAETSEQTVFNCDPATQAFLVQRLVNQTEHHPLELRACLYAALANYEKSVCWQPISAAGQDLQHRILLYISENYKDPITCAGMAAYLGYEPHYLSRRFNKLFGSGFCEFLSRYRVDAARELLGNRAFSVTQVAFECGFQSVRSFNRAFKGLTGVSPNRYREQARQTGAPAPIHSAPPVE